MDSIRINASVKRICIDDDPNRVIQFDPTDVAFAERFYGLIKEFEAKQSEYAERAKAIDDNKELDERGLPTNLGDALALLRDVCEFMRDRIDHVFGSGTAQTVFGNSLSLETMQAFFEGLTPFFQQARSERMKKYANENVSGRVMKS